MEGCKFDKPWMGLCGKPTVKGEIYCKEHLGEECVCCGGQATHECERASNMTCGAPLCSSEDCIKRHNEPHDKIDKKLYDRYKEPSIEDVKNKGIEIINKETEKTVMMAKDLWPSNRVVRDQCSRVLSFVTFMHRLGLITEREMLTMSGDITKQVFEDSIEEDR